MSCLIERLRERLELYATNGKGERLYVGFGADGIACRDETIKEQDATIDRLRRERDQLKAIVDRYCSRHDLKSCACEFGDDGDEPIQQCNYHLDLRRELAEEVELARALAEKLEADRKQLAEARTKIRNVANCLDTGMSPRDCATELRLIASDAFLAEKIRAGQSKSAWVYVGDEFVPAPKEGER